MRRRTKTKLRLGQLSRLWSNTRLATKGPAHRISQIFLSKCITSFFSFLKAAWLPKILNSKSRWSCLRNKYLSELSTKIQISSFRFDKIYDIKELANLPEFYKNIVFAYAKSNKPDTLADVLEGGNTLLYTTKMRGES